MKNLFKAAGQRLGGGRPGVLRAPAAAIAAGTAIGTLVYKLLRHHESGFLA